MAKRHPSRSSCDQIRVGSFLGFMLLMGGVPADRGPVVNCRLGKMDKVVLSCLGFYRRYLSKYTPHCNQKPICSTYAVQSVKKYGWLRGLELTFQRMENHG